MNRLSHSDIPSLFDQPSVPPTRAEKLFSVAESLLSVLSRGQELSASVVRVAMTNTFGGSDAEGLWCWKDAYEASEVAGVLFLRKFRTSLLKEDVTKQLGILGKIQSAMLTQNKRSDVSVAYQQFSTPFVLARLCAEAAMISLGDVCLLYTSPSPRD